MRIPNSRMRTAILLRPLAALVIMASLLTVPGCWGKRELEERSFVTLLGIDRGTDGNILVTTVVAVPRAVGGAGRMGGGGGTSAAVMLSGEGKNIREAMRQIEVMNSRELTTVHLAFLVVSEEFARTDVGPIVDLFSRSLEFRHNTLIAICRERAVDFLKGFQAIEEAEPSQYLLKLVTTTNAKTGACPVVTMHEFMAGYNTVAIDPWAPYVGLASAAPAEKPAGEKPQTGAGAGRGGGTDSQTTDEPKKVIRLFGTAMFTKVGPVNRMVGYLDVQESMAALLMHGTLGVGFLDIPYPGDQAETTLALIHSQSSSKVSLQDGSARATFDIAMTASLDESQVGGELPEASQQFRQALVHTAEDGLADLLQRTFTKMTTLGTDVIGLGREVQGKFPDYGSWEAFDWKARFKEAVATFSVKIHILTYGFTSQKPYPR